MATFEEGFRHFWLQNIHKITGVSGEDFRKWLTREAFLPARVTSSSDFAIQVLAPAEARKSIADDSSRLASAAFETMVGITSVGSLPRSTAWIVIRAYYAAFFAAHSLLRMCGHMCIQLDGPQTYALDHVARGMGVLPGTGFESGFYIANYSPTADEIEFQKSIAARRGSHEVLWASFADRLRNMSNHLIGVSVLYNSVALRIAEIETFLRQAGQNGGTWLSHIRNVVNYRQEFGLWFPYTNSLVDAAPLVRIVRKWRQDPARLFPPDQSNDIVLHVWICTAIVSICHAVAVDIEKHATGRRCFHSLSCLNLARQVNA
jgi:hypothetical protein